MNFWMTLESVQAFAKVSSQMFAEASAAHREDVAERAARMEPDPRGKGKPHARNLLSPAFQACNLTGRGP